MSPHLHALHAQLGISVGRDTAVKDMVIFCNKVCNNEICIFHVIQWHFGTSGVVTVVADLTMQC